MEKSIVRGCGKRVAGGVYIVTELSHKGLPLDLFLYDPPIVPTDDNGNIILPGAVGLQMMEYGDGLIDLWDWIGESHYPYFPDFWEEVSRYGLSRRMSASADFSKLKANSYTVGFHRRGIVTAKKAFYVDIVKMHEVGTGMDLCPQNLEHNIDDKENIFCVRFLWQLVDGPADGIPRLHEVVMPRKEGEAQFTYDAAHDPFVFEKPKYKAEWMPAAMYRLPIHRLEVIEDTVGGLHELAVDRLDKSLTELPYVVVKD